MELAKLFQRNFDFFFFFSTWKYTRLKSMRLRIPRDIYQPWEVPLQMLSHSSICLLVPSPRPINMV